MPRLSKAAWKRHEDAEAILSLDRRLTDDEIEQVLRDWNPAATNNVGAAGAFFTPIDMAWNVAVFNHLDYNGTEYLDLCAGIGSMLHGWVRWHSVGRERVHITAIEINPDYVEVGRRLFPDVEWIVGDVFDQDLIDDLPVFSVGVSNPPFGRVRTTAGKGDWLRYCGKAEYMVAEIMAHKCSLGGHLIVPAKSAPWRREVEDVYDAKGRVTGHRAVVNEYMSPEYMKWANANQGWLLNRTSLDVSLLTGFENTGVEVEIVELEFGEDYGQEVLTAGLPLFEGVPA